MLEDILPVIDQNILWFLISEQFNYSFLFSSSAETASKLKASPPVAGCSILLSCLLYISKSAFRSLIANRFMINVGL